MHGQNSKYMGDGITSSRSNVRHPIPAYDVAIATSLQCTNPMYYEWLLLDSWLDHDYFTTKKSQTELIACFP